MGNSRNDILRDPNNPIEAAEKLGKEIFSSHYADYRLDTERKGSVW